MAQLVKNPVANAGDTRDADVIPGSGRSLERGNGNLFQYSCLGNPMDRRAWWTKVHRVPENHTRLSYWAHVKLNYFIICYYKPTCSQHKPIKYFKFTPAKSPITETWKLMVVARCVKLSLRLLWTRWPLLPTACLCCCEACWGVWGGWGEAGISSWPNTGLCHGIC